MGGYFQKFRKVSICSIKKVPAPPDLSLNILIEQNIEYVLHCHIFSFFFIFIWQQENTIVEDLLYVLIGVEGQYILVEPLDSPFGQRRFKTIVSKTSTYLVYTI